jgi:hypothetical protein
MAAIISTGSAASSEIVVEPGSGAARVILVPRGYGFGVGATTGTIAAALAANSTVFAMRLDPGATRRAFIERVRIEYTTIVAYTTAVVAGRRLALFRTQLTGSSTGGTAIATTPQKHGISDTSEFSAANGGDIRIATTGTLTLVGATVDANPLRELSLAHVGAAGGFREATWEFSAAENQPLQLDPGQGMIIRNPVAMDAAGTWQLSVSIDWHEAPALDSSV